MAGLFDFDPQAAMNARWSADSKAATQLGPGYAAGMMARRGASGVLGSMGMQQPEVLKANKMKEIVEQSRDPGGDMEQTLRNLSKNLAAAGMMDESVKAAEMAENYKTKLLTNKGLEKDIELKDLDTKSKIADREAKAEIARQIATHKTLSKPWGTQAYEFYKSNVSKFTPESWVKWWDTMHSTNGNASEAAGVLKNYEAPSKDGVTWSPEFKHPVTGKMVQRGSNGQLRTVGGDEVSTMKVEVGGPDKGLMTADEFGKIGLAGERVSKIAEPFNQTLEKVSSLRPLIRLAKDKNTAASPALMESIVKVFKSDAQIAQKEADRIRNSGPLGQRVAQMIESFISGTVTSYKIGQIEEMLNVMEQSSLQGRNAALWPYWVMANQENEKGVPVLAPKTRNALFGVSLYGEPAEPTRNRAPAPPAPGAPAAPAGAPLPDGQPFPAPKGLKWDKNLRAWVAA